MPVRAGYILVRTGSQQHGKRVSGSEHTRKAPESGPPNMNLRRGGLHYRQHGQGFPEIILRLLTFRSEQRSVRCAQPRRPRGVSQTGGNASRGSSRCGPLCCTRSANFATEKSKKSWCGGLINNNNNSLFFQRTLTSLTSFETKALLFIGMEGQLITV